jgi:hypothetical protein
MDARHEPPDLDQLAQFVPSVGLRRPNTLIETWAPVLCVVADGECLQAASFAVGSQALADFAPEAWVAGAVGSSTVLRWETWDAESGWQQQPPTAPFQLADAAIDPDLVADATTQPLALPFTDRAGQMALYAERTFVRVADGASITVRSNPVLITLFEA